MKKEGAFDQESGYLPKSKEEFIRIERRLAEVRKEEFHLLDLVGKVKNKKYSLDMEGISATIRDEKNNSVYHGDASEIAHLLRFYDDMEKARVVGEFAREEEQVKSGKRTIKINEGEEDRDKVESAQFLLGEEDAYAEARMRVRGGGYVRNPEKDGSVVIKDEKGKTVFMGANESLLESRYRRKGEIEAYARFRQSSEHDACTMEETENEVLFKDKDGAVVFVSNAPTWLDSVYEYTRKGRSSEERH